MKGIVIGLLVFLSFSTNSCTAQNNDSLNLVQMGKSEYSIYIPPNAEDILMDTAKDLQQYIFKITNVKVPISNNQQSNNQIVVGDKVFAEELIPEVSFSKLGPSGFIINTCDTFLVICGNTNEGTRNGIYTFLEKFLNCRFYANDAIVIPKSNTISVSKINDVEIPDFDLRIVHSFEALSPEYTKWHKLHPTPRINPEWSSRYWAHSSTKYIAPKKYFKSNPEYFMLWNGKRKRTDVDWSNNEVFRLIKEQVESQIKNNQKIQYIGVSQADHNHDKLCQCGSCTKLLKQHQAPSGVVMPLVNKIAKSFPDKTVTTLAYQFSQKPPKNIEIEDNVMVMICNFKQSDVRKASYFKSDNSSPFMKDLRGWKELTDNLLVWDYTANLGYPYAPFPNIHLLQKNLKTFSALGVKKMFEQSHAEKGHEFQELRSYLLAKLLWDSSIDVDSVMNDFIDGYYGKASPYIKEYINSMEMKAEKNKSTLNRRKGVSLNSGYLSKEDIKEYEALFDKAMNAVATDKKILARVDNALQPLRYAKLELLKDKIPGYNKLLNEFTQKVEASGTEKISPKHKRPSSYKENE